MPLVDYGVDLEVIIPTITKGGDAVEDVREEVVIEEAPTTISHNVVLYQSGLRWPWKGEHDVGSIYHVCPCMARLAPNHAWSHDALL